MYALLLVLLVLVGIFLGVVILLQSGKGGGLAAMGGGAAASDVLGGRQATTVLTRATWTAGAIFMALSLILSIMSSRAQTPRSILEPAAPTNTAPTPVLPGLTDTPDTGSEPPAGETAPATEPGNPGL
ncbi:MAG: preprotein translocase subunit SecG [Gemmatimonadota bacterium]